MADSLFEGPEKKFELVVKPGSPALRDLGREVWDATVAAARANVLNVVSTDQLDAYLLSESSLFVFDDHVTMITCGRTRLVDAAVALIDRIGTDQIALLIYERKNEHFPELQPTNFVTDAARLDAILPGTARRFGTDHDHRIEMFVAGADYRPDPGDVTLEVLMHGLDTGAAEAFASGPAAGRTASSLGLDRLLEGFDIDEYAFEPAGYSLNAVRDAHYYTIHVTPESEGSYASFETNWDFSADPDALVGRVIECFTPESVDVLSFVPGGEPLSFEHPGYTRRKHVAGMLAGYQITFASMFIPRGLEEAVEIGF